MNDYTAVIVIGEYGVDQAEEMYAFQARDDEHAWWEAYNHLFPLHQRNYKPCKLVAVARGTLVAPPSDRPWLQQAVSYRSQDR